MLRKLAAAAIAVSLIAGPAFAQGNAPAPTSQPVTKTIVKVKEIGAVTVKTRKHVSLHHRHHVRHYAHVKHLTHVKHFAHAKHVKHFKQVKRINQPIKSKIAG